MKKLEGSYKNRHKRNRPDPPVFFSIECPGCGWKSGMGRPEEVERKYIMHIKRVHVDLSGFPPITAVEERKGNV